MVTPMVTRGGRRGMANELSPSDRQLVPSTCSMGHIQCSLTVQISFLSPRLLSHRQHLIPSGMIARGATDSLPLSLLAPVYPALSTGNTVISRIIGSLHVYILNLYDYCQRLSPDQPPTSCIGQLIHNTVTTTTSSSPSSRHLRLHL